MSVELSNKPIPQPQMPAVQSIPIELIRPNPENPGPAITEDQVKELAENIAEVGLRNPIKVMADQAQLPAGERATYLILSGELRYRVFLYLQRPFIPAYILTPTPEEAVILTRMDNITRDRGWWADYQTIEQLRKVNSSLPQRQIATRLKLPLPLTNRALNLLPMLNTAARALLVTHGNNQNKEIRGISERAVSQLAGLGANKGQKPDNGNTPVNPETQDLIYRALVMAIDHEMTENQVKGLVQAIKAGTPPEEYGKAAGSPQSTADSKTTTDSPADSHKESAQPPVEPSAQGRQKPSNHGPWFETSDQVQQPGGRFHYGTGTPKP